MSKVTVIPRDEEAIEEARKEAGWKMNARTFEGMSRKRLMSIAEDNWDYEAIPSYGGNE
jgi:hypothetical protein